MENLDIILRLVAAAVATISIVFNAYDENWQAVLGWSCCLLWIFHSAT